MFESGFDYLSAVLAFSGSVYALNLWLDYRQLKALAKPAPPPETKELYADKDSFQRAVAYQSDKLRFGMVSGTWDTLVSAAQLVYGFLPFTWSLAYTITTQLPFLASWGIPAQSAVWTLILGAQSLILGLPWSAYKTFVLESRHGFNKTTVGTFFLDIVKSCVLGVIMVPPIVAGIASILEKAGPWVALHLWLFLLALSLFLMTIYPVVIQPLFNTFTPLPEGQLRQAIEELAATLNFPLKKLFVVDGSRRSAHSNAYFFGFFKSKRIVLYDTLVENHTTDQIVAVLAHELGHWKKRHTSFLFVSGQVQLLLQLVLFTLFKNSEELHKSFGFEGKTSAFVGLVLFGFIMSPVDEVLGLLNNIISRTFEFQADAFAVSLEKGVALRDALLTLDKENKGPPNVDALYSAYHFSHPPLGERLKAIDQLVKKSE